MRFRYREYLFWINQIPIFIIIIVTVIYMPKHGICYLRLLWLTLTNNACIHYCNNFAIRIDSMPYIYYIAVLPA